MFIALSTFSSFKPSLHVVIVIRFLVDVDRDDRMNTEEETVDILYHFK